MKGAKFAIARINEILYEGLNHAFTKGIYTDLNKVKKEYSVRRNVDQSVMDDIAQFIKG